MQWDGSQFAGFTTGTPWLRLGADHATVNVATLSGQKEAVLSLYRSLIALRNGNAALNSGRIEGVASKGRILSYERVDDGQRFAIVLNFDQSGQKAAIAGGHIVASTHMDRNGEVVESKPIESVRSEIHFNLDENISIH